MTIFVVDTSESAINDIIISLYFYFWVCSSCLSINIFLDKFGYKKFIHPHYETKIKSLSAHIRIVGLCVINLGKNPNNRFGELIHLYVPLFQQVDSILWLEAADVEKDAVGAEFFIDKFEGVLELALG